MLSWGLGLVSTGRVCLFSFLLILEPSSRNSGFAGIRLVRVEVSSETGGGLAPHFLSLVMLLFLVAFSSRATRRTLPAFFRLLKSIDPSLPPSHHPD